MSHSIFDNKYLYNVNFKRKDNHKKLLFTNNHNQISISYLICKPMEVLKAINFYSEYSGTIKLCLYIDKIMKYENIYDINEGLNYLNIDDIIVNKNQVVKIVIENIGKRALLLYLQNDDLRFIIDDNNDDEIYKILNKDRNLKDVQLFRMSSMGEDMCTYLHEGKEETFTKYFNDGNKYVVTDIVLLTSSIE